MTADGNSLNGLVARAQAGDREALGVLLEQARPTMLALVNRRLPKHLQTQVAEEIVEDAYLRVLAAVPGPSWKDADAFFAWLRVVIDHRRMEWWKHATRIRRDWRRTLNERQLDGPHGRGAGLLAEAFYHKDSPIKEAWRNERDAVLHTALEKHLSPREREAVELRYLKGLTVTVTAFVMECSPKAVRDLTSGAMEKLRTALGRPSQFFSSRLR